MRERLVQVPTPSGPMDAFVTHPEEGIAPAVILYMDVWGLREELFDIARRVAVVGYYCMVPDFYHRQGQGVRTEFRDVQNRMVSLHNLDQATQQQVLKPMLRLADADVVEDTGAILRFLAAGEPARAGAMGAVGWCMGGRHALQAAAHHAGRFRASASLHGTMLASDKPDLPHRKAAMFQGEVYCGFGEKDPYTPPALIDAFAAAMRDAGAAYRCEVHRGCQHGYALPDRDIYDKAAANRDWELIFAMFRRQLGGA